VGSKPEVVEHYSAPIRDCAAEVHGDVRREAFGVDVGQNSWLTVDGLERFGSLLELGPSACFLDVACGSGGPTLHLAGLAECEAVGVELYEEPVATGRRAAADAGLEGRLTFVLRRCQSP
jgi:SAM-dependent methyltransferase